MRALIPLLGTLTLGGLLLAVRSLTRSLYPRAFVRWGRIGTLAFVAAWAIGFLAAGARASFGLSEAGPVAFVIFAGTGVFLLCILGPLAIGRVLAWLGERGHRRERPTAESSHAATTRRELLVTTGRIIPAAGVLAAGVGGVQGLSAARLRQIEMTFPNLPPDLEGFSILHYTDMHLGTFIDLAEAKRLVELGRTANADLVVLTGDMADDLDGLLPALRHFESLDPPHGVIASIGNHEYFRGIKKSLVTYARTTVETLVERGVDLRVGETTLYVGGADDPRVLRGDKMAFMERTVNNALDGAPSNAFRLLLSHRPEGFVPAANAGFHLTLSGHTHGAQLGFNGRSLLEGFMPDRFLWGSYHAGDKRLYTSAGAGHWFPFRIGCPREVPLIVLRRSVETGCSKDELNSSRCCGVGGTPSDQP